MPEDQGQNLALAVLYVPNSLESEKAFRELLLLFEPYLLLRLYLIESLYNVVLHESIPAQIRQLILYISNNNGYVTDLCEK